MPKSKKVTISISNECYAKLEEQLNFIKDSNVKEFEKIKTIEQLIEKYLEQLTATNSQFEEIQDKMHEMMKIFTEKGLDISEILNTFSEKIFEKGKKPGSKKNFNKKN